MDSLTQIILGAACGEAVLGKKIGNKALLFGAIGGTIPDLDVFIGKIFYNNEIDIMAFHRGFMHSIVFAVFGAFVFGWLVYKLYNTRKRLDTTTLKDWVWLFFWALFTHPILDCFTPYGTQLFAPFSDYRVAFNNISVVDPIYTIPFLICMIVLMFFKRNTSRRNLWLKIGIGMSSVYMLFTLGNKIYIDRVFKKSFEAEGISFERFRTQPSIFNNVLWYGIAETNTDYHVGFYSLFDASEMPETLLKIPKRHDLIDINHPDLQTLSWFSNGYFNLIKKDDSLAFVDLRYPLLKENDPESAVLVFKLKKQGQRWDIKPFYSNPPTKEDFKAFWERIKGI